MLPLNTYTKKASGKWLLIYIFFTAKKIDIVKPGEIVSVDKNRVFPGEMLARTLMEGQKCYW